MKTILGILGFLAALALVYYLGAQWAMSKRPVSNETFAKRMDSLSKITKKLEMNQDTIKRKQDTLLLDVDSLKLGQKIIFDEVKKSNTSFWDLF